MPASSQDRFEKLASGEIDVLIRTTTWTTSRDAELNADFAGMNFYDGQGILIREDAFPAANANNSVSGLDGATICVGTGTTTEGNLQDYFTSHGIAFTAEPVGDAAEATQKFIDGACDAFTGDMSAMVVDDLSVQHRYGHQPVTERLDSRCFWPTRWLYARFGYFHSRQRDRRHEPRFQPSRPRPCHAGHGSRHYPTSSHGRRFPSFPSRTARLCHGHLFDGRLHGCSGRTNYRRRFHRFVSLAIHFLGAHARHFHLRHNGLGVYAFRAKS
uniref:Periplasmic substrate binding protein n=1 Tax=uncultured marine group III euryarchaeote KM3-28-E8 TaxID=526676 RepID=B3V6K7_9ARCH|nr:periplasmic substrate binding protein [uncultured marine group III euryarchaeote KM3-28-E8]